MQDKLLPSLAIELNRIMNVEKLVNQGNTCREDNQPVNALSYYAQAFTYDPDNFSAWNNYGNVLRELGRPDRAIPFLHNALAIAPDQPTANFNLAVCHLLLGDYERGWKQYEHRWRYEHLNGILPQHTQPKWTGQDLKGKTILVWGEQGHGDNIQFARFIYNLHEMGARIILQTTDALMSLFSPGQVIAETLSLADTPTGFDYWIPIMSIPGVLGITLDKLGHHLSYIGQNPQMVKEWGEKLGPKQRLRVGFCWSGRRDTWINRHKAMPFEEMLKLIKKNPSYEWINLQLDCTEEETRQLEAEGIASYPELAHGFSNTAALMMHLDVVLSVDTAVAHLGSALGRPTWIMLNAFATDWRWLLNRDDSPWYPSARLFRQPNMGNWIAVTDKVNQYLSWFKV